MKNEKTEFFLCLFGGYFGLHKFYEGKIKQGILYIFTLGLFTMGWIVDSINLYKVAFKVSPEEMEITNKNKAKKQEEKTQRKIAKKEKRKEEIEQIKADMELDRQRVANMKRQGVAFCPKCKSTSITYVERHKKLSVGRAITGGVLAGEAGAVLGGLSSKKVKGMIKCLNCGHSWKK